MMIPAYLFPWIFFVVLGLAQSWRAWRRDGDLDAAFLFVWFVAIFLLFTAIPAKRDRYLLPLVPCAGLLCARYFVLGLRDGFRRPKLHRRLLLVMLVVMGVAALFLGATPWLARLWVRKFYGGEAELREHLQFLTSPGGIAIAAAVSLVLLAVVAAGIRAIVTRPQSLRPVWALLAWMVLLSLVLDLLAFPIMNPIKSGRSFAAAALPYLRDADESRMFGDEYSGVINLYTGIVSIPVIQDETALLKMLEQPGGTGRIAVITDMKRYERIREKLPPGLSVAVQERIGHRSMLLLCNWPIPGAG
jgi:hypothetical protein